MEEYFTKIMAYVFKYIEKYPLVSEPDYFDKLTNKYFSLEGYIFGFVFVALVWFANVDEKKKSGVLKVLSIITVINGSFVLIDFLNKRFNVGMLHNDIGYSSTTSDNIISGFILTLVIISCYRGTGKKAICLGLATHTALMILDMEGYDQLKHVLAHISKSKFILLGITCWIISESKHFFKGWIWYFIFHMIIRLPIFFQSLGNEFAINGSPSNVKELIWRTVKHRIFFTEFTLDYIIFILILGFAIVFETMIIPEKAMRAR